MHPHLVADGRCQTVPLPSVNSRVTVLAGLLGRFLPYYC
jgi:hypothetical protein